MTIDTNATSRRAILTTIAGLGITVAAPTFAGAPGLLRRAGNYRRIKMRNERTGEKINTIYYIDGKYIRPALREINWFMRDWRENDAVNMDTRNIDIMSTAHRILNTTEPYLLLSGYRSPKTNAMLRRRSRGVARNSLHIKAMAADLRLKSRSINHMAKAAQRINGGGVGRYARSNFVHMDCGTVRTWNG